MLMQSSGIFFRIENPDTQLRGIANPTRKDKSHAAGRRGILAAEPCHYGVFVHISRVRGRNASPLDFHYPKNQNVMKYLRKQTNCSVLADFRDVTFVQSGPNSRFLRDFFAQNGASVQVFVSVIHLLEQSDEKFRGRNAKFRAPEFFFRGLEFLFRGSDEKIPVQKLFRGGLGDVFLSRWNFFPNTFSVSFCRRNPPAGFPAGRTSAPGVSRVPSKGQVWREFRDILIPAWRVWLRSFRAVPARWPDTRIP